MYRYVIVYLLDPLPDGAGFQAKDWPLHVTLLPPFTVDIEPDVLCAELAHVAELNRPVTTNIIGKDLFGRHGTVPVKTMDKPDGLQQLHDGLAKLATDLGATHVDPRHLGEGYRPHVSDKHHGQADVGQTVHIDNFSLVQIIRESRPNRFVYCTFQL